MIKTVDNDFSIINSDYEFNYQTGLTQRLDNLDANLNQEIINEIVLWKINRYAGLSDHSINLINRIPSSNIMDEDLTKEVLTSLLNDNGIQLPLASTILRFKNPHVYQIIDQRVFRIIYGYELKIISYKTSKNISSNIEIYLEYLSNL